MTVYHYKITALLDSANTMIVNLFTDKNMEESVEKEGYLLKLLDHGVCPNDIEFERINEYNSNTPFFTTACEGMIYILENSN